MLFPNELMFDFSFQKKKSTHTVQSVVLSAFKDLNVLFKFYSMLIINCSQRVCVLTARLLRDALNQREEEKKKKI